MILFRLPSPKEGKPTPVGIAIIRALKSRIEKLKADGHPIDVIYETKAVDLITKKVDTRSDVVGVKVRRGNASEVENLDADRVVLATGGFSNDHEKDSLLEEFAPNVVSFPTTNGPFATGSGVKMGRKLGKNYCENKPCSFVLHVMVQSCLLLFLDQIIKLFENWGKCQARGILGLTFR